jgi:hypothetical protein
MGNKKRYNLPTVGFMSMKLAMIKLAEPEDFVGLPDFEWNYSSDPIGPGTLGYGKDAPEIEDLRNNYLLVDDFASASVGFLLKPSGLYLAELKDNDIKRKDKLMSSERFYKKIQRRRNGE